MAGSLLPFLGCGGSAGGHFVAEAGRNDSSDDLVPAIDGSGNSIGDTGNDAGSDAEDGPAGAAASDAEDAVARSAPSDAEIGGEDAAASPAPSDAEIGAEDGAANPPPGDAEIDAEDGVAGLPPSDAEIEAGSDATIDAVSDIGGDAGGDAVEAAPVVPLLSGTVYSFVFEDTTFAVDAARGARIVSFSLAGRNILTTPVTGDPSNYGSTFWSSPQSDWNWPPPSQIDPGPYVGSAIGGDLFLTGAPATNLGLAVTKEFSADGGAGVVTIQYGLVNRGSQPRAFAPWEITRVAAGGLTFFPMGDGSPSKGSQDLLSLKIVDGVAWFAYDTKLITNDQKVFADGSEGWIAHANGDLLLVKSFADTPSAQAAPGEAEIEIYTNAAHTYIEVENQGAYTSLAPAEKSVWTVRWFLRKLDPSVSVTIGSADLLQVVRALVR